MVSENQMAPDFEVPAHDGSPVRLSELRGRRVILFFYPRADTPGCTVEACEFRDMTPQIQEQGAIILGISPDGVEAVRKFREKFDLPFTLLADEDHSVAAAYGVWSRKQMFGKKHMGVDRTTFLIDADGRVEKVFRKVKAEGHAGEVLSGL